MLHLSNDFGLFSLCKLSMVLNTIKNSISSTITIPKIGSNQHIAKITPPVEHSYYPHFSSFTTSINKKLVAILLQSGLALLSHVGMNSSQVKWYVLSLVSTSLVGCVSYECFTQKWLARISEASSFLGSVGIYFLSEWIVLWS